MKKATFCNLCSLFAITALGPTASAADESPIKPAFGFDLSFAAAMPNDRRFTGSTVGFELSLLEIANKIRVGLYHEQGRWHGSDGDEHVTASSSFNALHLDFSFLAAASQKASLFLNAGHITFHDGLSKSAFAADLGVRYDPFIASRRGLTTHFGVSLCYRYSHLSSTEVFGAGSEAVDNAGGFLAGVHGLVRF